MSLTSNVLGTLVEYRSVLGWLIDTHVVSSLIAPNGAPSVKAWARAVEEEHRYLSIITLAEYDKGIHNLDERKPNRARYAASRDALEGRFKGRVLPVEDKVVRCWGQISGRVQRETGHPPPVIDTLLAATAIEASLDLVSRNVRDVRHCGAAVFNPWADRIAEFPISRR